MRYSLRATLHMRVDGKRFTTDAHAGNIAKIYGLYNNFSNVRHHAGLPAGQPTMTWMVKIDKIKPMYKYLAYLNILCAQ